MNFIPCRLEQNGAGLTVRLSDQIALPMPGERAERYRKVIGKALIFGLRPEHITEPRGESRDARCEFSAALDVIEPMGMETMVFFGMNGTEVCARCEPSSVPASGQSMRLYLNLNHMHLINPETQLVL
jgi:multiple sugar transport system ATP-binding protein